MPRSLARRVLEAVVVATCAIALQSRAAPVPVRIDITVDEDGSGTVVSPGPISVPLPGTLQADPGPGGLNSALTYGLPTLGTINPTAGDVFLLEPASNENSDLVRFNLVGSLRTQTFSPSLVFYSDTSDGSDALADTGFPSSFYANPVSLDEVGPEGNNGADYVPTAGQPGFYDSAYDVHYHFISDLPEPSMGALIFLCALFPMRRRRKSSTAECGGENETTLPRQVG